jgi:hypothetical protein
MQYPLFFGFQPFGTTTATDFAAAPRRLPGTAGFVFALAGMVPPDV